MFLVRLGYKIGHPVGHWIGIHLPEWFVRWYTKRHVRIIEHDTHIEVLGGYVDRDTFRWSEGVQVGSSGTTWHERKPTLGVILEDDGNPNDRGAQDRQEGQS